MQSSGATSPAAESRPAPISPRRPLKPSGPNPCEALTRDAVEELVEAIDASLRKANDNVRENGPQAAGANYPRAATLSAEHLYNARNAVEGVLEWLDSEQLFAPNNFVTNTTGAFSIYGVLRDAVWQLHHGRHWAAVSAASNSPAGDPPRDARAASECIDLATTALALAEPLSAKATRCYLREYLGS
jgi:hypothetical protein